MVSSVVYQPASLPFRPGSGTPFVAFVGTPQLSFSKITGGAGPFVAFVGTPQASFCRILRGRKPSKEVSVIYITIYYILYIIYIYYLVLFTLPSDLQERSLPPTTKSNKSPLVSRIPGKGPCTLPTKPTEVSRSLDAHPHG
jgi:hypothetical protein